MKCALLAVLALTPSCYSTTTSAGRFVTDVTIAGGELVVVDCEVTQTVMHTLDGNSTNSNAENCSTDRWSLRDARGPCGVERAAWRALWARGTPTADDQQRLWSSFSRQCRAALDGGAP